jgi:hypothetical protein
MYYNRARYYDPSNGRFNRLDPASGNRTDPQSLHKYLYSHANPINAVDPTGMQAAFAEQLTVWQAMAIMIAQVVPYLLLGAVVLGAAIGIALVLQEVLPPILDAIAEGVEGAERLYAAAVASAGVVAKAVEDALSKASKALGKPIKKLRPLKKFFLFKTPMPNIYAFTVSCLTTRPDWFVLNYHANKKWATQNRNWVRWHYRHLKKPHYSIDEFPYASTAQGGPAGPARATLVPQRENWIQGGYLWGFYRVRLKKKPQPFLVVPLPI